MTDIEKQDRPEIDAEPTKSFFVDMLTRDIPLEQAVLDLVDNSVDAAKAMQGNGDGSFEGREVRILFSAEEFRIYDNCGGFDSEAARTYAFKFGRKPGAPRTAHSIGQFGVGMKRALFKFGNHFIVRSATATDDWAVDVPVPQWETAPGWHFPWATFEPDEHVSRDKPGTEVIVDTLRTEVKKRFATQLFENQIINLIKSKHRQFISAGLRISVNRQHIDATNIYLLVRDAQFQPGTDVLLFQDEGEADVTARIVVGVGPSLPRDAGWYVVCNGRVVLEHDRSGHTGWGLLEEQSNNIMIPSFHNQFARFRGIVSFDSEDSARVPWNTTKTDVDQDNPVWQGTFGRMMEMMRPVINFLNELDSDIDEHTREYSPLHDFVSGAQPVTPEALPERSTFVAPARTAVSRRGPRTIKVQYSKPVDQVDYLMEELSLGSAKAVGEKTFELIYQRMRGE